MPTGRRLSHSGPGDTESRIRPLPTRDRRGSLRCLAGSLTGGALLPPARDNEWSPPAEPAGTTNIGVPSGRLDVRLCLDGNALVRLRGRLVLEIDDHLQDAPVVAGPDAVLIGA